MCDFQSELFDTQSWYRQTLLGTDQSGNALRNFTVNMTVNMIVNGFLNIQIFKWWKSCYWWPRQGIREFSESEGLGRSGGGPLMRTDVWNVFCGPLDRSQDQKWSNGHITVSWIFAGGFYSRDITEWDTHLNSVDVHNIWVHVMHMIHQNTNLHVWCWKSYFPSY